MTYEEAIKLAYQVKWKTSTCGQGEQCWCRIVEPEIKIEYIEGKFYDGTDIMNELYIIGSGGINKEFAEYFVRLHNNTIDGKL